MHSQWYNVYKDAASSSYKGPCVVFGTFQHQILNNKLKKVQQLTMKLLVISVEPDNR